MKQVIYGQVGELYRAEMRGAEVEWSSRRNVITERTLWPRRREVVRGKRVQNKGYCFGKTLTALVNADGEAERTQLSALTVRVR